MKIRIWAVLILSVGLLWGGSGHVEAVDQQVLGEMPSGLMMYAATAPLDEISQKLSGYIERLGLEELVKDDEGNAREFNIADALSEELMGAKGMIDGSRGIGFAVADLTNAEETMVAVVPVTDAMGVLKALEATRSAEAPGIWVVQSDLYAKASGKWLVFGPKEETLVMMSGRSKGVTLSASDQRLFGESDVAATVELGTLMAMVKMMAMGALMQEEKIQSNPALMGIIGKYVDLIDDFKGVSMGVVLGTRGLGLKIDYHCEEGSELAGYFSGHPKAGLGELASLPPGDYSGAYVMSFDGEKFRPFLDSILDLLVTEETMREKIGMENISELRSLMNYKFDFRGAFAEYAPEDGEGSGVKRGKMFGVGRYLDLDQMLAASRKMMPVISRIMDRFGFKMLMEYKTSAGTVMGLPYDEVVVDLSEMEMPAGAKEALAMQWGGKLLFTEQFCKLDDERLAFSLNYGGGNDIEEIVKFVRSGQSGLDKDPSIVKAAQDLPAKANVFMFSNIGTAMRSAMAKMPPEAQMFAGMLSQMKGVVGASVIMEDGSVKTQVHIPTEMIQSIIDMVKPMLQMQEMMQKQAPTPN